MKTKINEKKEEIKKPVQKFRSGNVSATIWDKEIDVNNKKVTIYTVSIERSYKDGDDWKKTNTYNKNDLIKLKVVLDKATEFLYLNDDEEYIY